MRTPHDLLFKELLSAFAAEFLEMFLPDLFKQIEPGSLKPVDKELYPYLSRKGGRQADLILEARIRGQKSLLAILVEHESGSRAGFPRRLFHYVARAHENLNLPVYPVVIYSYARPYKPGRDHYSIEVLGQEVLRMQFQVVQLNRLNWRSFVSHPNPLASALMARMRVKPADRPHLKLLCLKILASHPLDSRKSEVATKFIDGYSQLTDVEEAIWLSNWEQLNPEEKKQMQQYITTWERRAEAKGLEAGLEAGLEQGLEQGFEKGLKVGLKAGLAASFGSLSRALELRIEACTDLPALERLATALSENADLASLESLLP